MGTTNPHLNPQKVESPLRHLVQESIVRLIMRMLLILRGMTVMMRVEEKGRHYFHVFAVWEIEREGIMSSRYSRWRSTAEVVLWADKLGFT